MITFKKILLSPTLAQPSWKLWHSYQQSRENYSIPHQQVHPFNQHKNVTNFGNVDTKGIIEFLGKIQAY